MLLPVVLKLPARSFAHRPPGLMRHAKGLHNLFNFLQIYSYALAQLYIHTERQNYSHIPCGECKGIIDKVKRNPAFWENS